MKVRARTARKGSASKFVAYLLRGTETGACCATEALKDSGRYHELLASQKRDFDTKFSSEVVEWWRNRELTENDSKKVHQNRERVLLRDEVFRQKSARVRKGTAAAQEITDAVHVISQTQQYMQPNGRTGIEFTRPLPNYASSEQILGALRGIRACVPKDIPAVFTVHYDGHGKNLHIQGWISTRPWDAENKTWAAPSKLLTTPKGLSAFRKMTDEAVEQHDLKWKGQLDVAAPKVTVHHPYIRNLVQNISHKDFLKGEFLAGIQNDRLRMCAKQTIDRARYFEQKRSNENVQDLMEFHELWADRLRQTGPNVSDKEDVMRKLTRRELFDMGRETMMRIQKVQPVVPNSSGSDGGVSSLEEIQQALADADRKGYVPKVKGKRL